MDQGTLVIEEKEAGKDLINRISRSRPVQAAFWLKTPESSRRYLYIAADGIDSSNIDQGYREVLRSCGEMQGPYLDPFQVKLIATDNPLALAVMEIHRRYPGRGDVDYHGASLGGVSIEDAYLYRVSELAPVKLS